MTAGGALHLVVRTLPASGLEGGFRVHISPEGLEQVGLRVGEVCRISGENGEINGVGIAWRASDKMGSQPKLRPVKMSETMRNAFNIKEGSHVTISKIDAKLVPAKKVVVSDVTPSNYVESEVEDEGWITKITWLLHNCEAFTGGMTFDVSAKKGLRKRFYVEHVEASASGANDMSLFYHNDGTQISIADPLKQSGESLNGTTGVPGEMGNVLSTKSIGGLVEQVESLNFQMKRTLMQMSASSKNPANANKQNPSVLIHGYEGTGKSMILQKIEECAPSHGFRRVVRLETSTLSAGTAVKNQAMIQNLFSQAKSSQPSIVAIDNLERLASSSEYLYADHIAKELSQLRGCDVLVIATCSTPSDVNNLLVGPRLFSILVELPIPDLKARKSILSLMFEPNERTIVDQLALKTHGFTGKDLEWLIEVAKNSAFARRMPSDSRSLADFHFDSQETLKESKMTNGHSDDHSAAHLENEVAEAETNVVAAQPQITSEDVDAALTKVRPTALREIFFETPKVKWSDIGGSEAIKARFDRIIGWPLRHPEILASSHKKPTKGVLLYGPPGCSKTLTAQAVATIYELNFIAVQGAELVSMYVGESERAVREVFRKARTAAPCVIFFDEIDSIAGERDSAGTKGLNVLTTLLNEMDGFKSLQGVTVLAATNKPEVLDPAIMRPGRFDAHIYLGPPNEAARKEILHINLDSLQLADDIDFDGLAASTEGHSGAEVVQICELAKDPAIERAIDGGDARITMDDLSRALSQSPKGITEEMLEGYRQYHR